MNKSFEFGTKVGPFTIVFLMSSLDSCNRSVYFAQDGDMNPAVLYCFAKPFSLMYLMRFRASSSLINLIATHTSVQKIF